jgi:hypothetical protein
VGGNNLQQGHNGMPFLRLFLRRDKSERASPGSKSSDTSQPVRKSLMPADRAMFLIAISVTAMLCALLVIRAIHRGGPLGPGQMIMIGFVVGGALCLVRLSAARRK